MLMYVRVYTSVQINARVTAISALADLGLVGSYVVPTQPGTTALQMSAQYQAVGVLPAPPAAPVTQTFTARLYPSNAEASRIGMVERWSPMT